MTSYFLSGMSRMVLTDERSSDRPTEPIIWDWIYVNSPRLGVRNATNRQQMILVLFFSEELRQLPAQHSSILGNHGKLGSISKRKFLLHHIDYSLAVYIFRKGSHHFYQFLMIFWKEWTRSLTTMVHNGQMSSMSRQCFSLFFHFIDLGTITH